MNDLKHQKPKRPFGLTIAIVITVLFYAVLPLLFVAGRFMIEDYVSREQEIVLPDGTVTTAQLSGVENTLPISALLIQVGISGGVIGLAFFAFRGRPSWIRWLFMLAVAAIALYTALEWFNIVTDSTLEGGSGDVLGDILNVILVLIVPPYVLWYMNRSPARAFYRGYYTDEDIAYYRWLMGQEEDDDSSSSDVVTG
jgi:hypothetical protein